MGASTDTLQTGWDDSTPSQDTLALTGLRAMADRAVEWATAAGGRVRRQPGLVLADAGSSCLFLNVANSAAPVDDAAARDIAEFFPPDRGFLLVSPNPTPDLQSAGLTLMGHPPFLVRPAGGTPPAPSGGVIVTEMHDEAGLAAWDGVVAAGFSVPASPAPSALLGGSMRFWLAYVDGQPAATALSYVAHGVVNVESVATLPRYRRRGVGTAATWAATLAEPTLPAVLIASDDGVGCYRRMGYLPLMRWTLWFRP